MGAEIGLEIVEGFVSKLALQGLKELGLRDVDVVERGGRNLLRLEVRVQLKRGCERVDLSDLHRVVDVVGIAALDSCKRGVGQGGFNLHGGGSLPVGLRLRHTGEHQQLCEISYVALADLLAPGVSLGVIVAVGKPESASANANDHDLGIFRILLRADIKKV